MKDAKLTSPTANDASLLFDNLPLILSNRDRILNNPEYFNCQVDQAYLAYWGGGKIPLGVLLTLWHSGKMLSTCAKCGSSAFIVGLGSTPSGSLKSYWGVCTTCKDSFTIRTPIDFQDNLAMLMPMLKQYRNEAWTEREVDGQVFDWGGLKPMKRIEKAKVEIVHPVTLAELVEKLS